MRNREGLEHRFLTIWRRKLDLLDMKKSFLRLEKSIQMQSDSMKNMGIRLLGIMENMSEWMKLFVLKNYFDQKTGKDIYEM